MARFLDLARQWLAAKLLAWACDIHPATVDYLVEQSVRDLGWLPPLEGE